MNDNANLYARLARAFVPAATLLEVPGGARYSYAEADQASARTANALLGLGLKRGDCVAVCAEKSPALVWLYLACLRAGCIYQPLNPSYSERELAFFIGDAGARVLIHDPAVAGRASAAAAHCPALMRCLTLDEHGQGEMAALAAAASSAFNTVTAAADENCALLYSSGTTGTPKGIPLTHDNLYHNALALRAAWAFEARDVLLHALPLYHVHGLFITLNPALLAGMTLRFLPRFDATAVLAALPGASVMAGVPTYYTRLLDQPAFDRAACSTVRLFISGSAPLLETTFHEFATRTGQVILERYGMTETGINTANPLHGERKPGAVGPPLAGVDVRVVDAAGSALATATIGEIEVRGPNVFRGYWRLPEQTASVFSADGFFRTGDQGRFDGDGYLHIVGRSKDMIITGGLNVYPKEIEGELELLPGVTEAAVFGVPHADFGEAVIAAVIAEDGVLIDEAATIAHLRGRLAGYKLPKRIVQLGELPRNAMGKVQKNRLREDYVALLANAAAPL